MGRNKKHKKEKSKTQLRKKVDKTKFLPKGGNITDVNFKLKSIVLREQLKTSSTVDELVTKKKLNLKDLLTRLNHYNTTMRFQACEGLLELTSSLPTETIELNLYIILQGICKLLIDIESKVRHKAIKALGEILKRVSNIKASSFSEILISYVLCAMTHINIAIQEDSLLVIDIYLEHIPDLIIKNFDKVFSNFLTLISKLRSDSKLSRTLTVNLGSKLTSIKWRIKVLSRLHSILKLVTQRQNNDSIILDKSCKVVKCDGVTHVPLYRNIGTPSATDVRINSTLEESEAYYINMLLPLLYETWAEAVPIDEIKYHENSATLIGQDAASILSCVVGIVHALMNFLKYSNNESNMHNLFVSKENKLIRHFLNQFPYRQQNFNKKVEKELTKLLILNTDPKCVQENLLICYAFCILYKTTSVRFYLEKASGLLEYINVCLSHRNYIPPKSIGTIILVLRVIYFENFSYWQQKSLVSEKLLDHVINFHNNLPIDGEYRMEVFTLLVDIAKEPKITPSDKFLLWLNELPLLLLKPEISIQFVDTLCLLAHQNNKAFLEALRNILPQFLTNLPQIQIIDDDLPPAHIKLIHMLYFIRNFSSKDIELFQSFVETYKNWIFVEHFKLLLLK